MDDKWFEQKPTMKPWGASPREASESDRDFLLALDRQLADAVTFLPPAMRASFHAQVGALIKLVTKLAVPQHWDTDTTNVSIAEWCIERQRIAERTGG
jgi:hypothetical protein